MEYLPEKKRTQKIQVLKKEEKTRQFREFLADQGVVLALVKYLLALRTADPKPEDPVEHLRDYFGRYRDPMWDVVEQLIEENNRLRAEEIPSLTQNIEWMEMELKGLKMQNQARDCYLFLDPERTNQISSKLMIQKLSGFAKFDLDMKVEWTDFAKILQKMCQETIEKEEEYESAPGVMMKQTTKINQVNEQKYDSYLALFTRAFRDNQPPFQGDLENEVYKLFIQVLREHFANK